MTDQSLPLYIPAFRPLYARLQGLAVLVARVLAGVLFIPHGYAKLFVAPDHMAKFFGSLGFPPVVGLLMGILEFFGGIALVVGLFTRPIAFMFFIEMLVAAFLVHLPKGWMATSGGAEYVIALAFLSLVVAILGSGRYSVDRLIGREF